jgi:hypothetical protein
MKNTIETSIEKNLFQDHYNYYKEIGIETIKQQAGQVEQVSSDYQGRVIYELLQNAFDKAQEKILVKVFGDSLYVANDGTKFNFTSNYDYKNGSLKRGDFQSMCSISTSTKNASTSIGNKGVGFKSAFSIANDGFVNVFTRGEIMLNEEKIEDDISFRIYDSFKDVSSLPKDFDGEIIENITNKINLVQKERIDRGVPGYYFPLHIENEESFIQELFNDGFVTVIEIPFQNKEEIKKLFEEIENIHFQFIQLKYPDYPASFEIEFCFDNEEHTKIINKKTNKLFSAIVDNDELKKLAKELGISIEKPEIAFFIKDKPGGLFYNYLPTQVKSPFKYVDFHADFHTTVDRKSINFDGKIGLYNKALLRACFELYFLALNNSLPNEDRVVLNLKYLKNHKTINNLKHFNWKLIEKQETINVFYFITDILKISDWQYETAANLFSKLGKKHFSYKKSSKEHKLFIDNVLNFIYHFSSNSMQFTLWVGRFKEKFARTIRDNEVNIIPGIDLFKNTELIYRKKSKSDIKLPDFLGINITDFEIKDEHFKKALGIKDFTDNNEILKYFKQCSFTGDYAPETISEEKQKDLIKNIYFLFEAKNEKDLLSTHRITRAITNKDRDNNSTLNQANFNISTVFLKTKLNKYKPAQLCLSSEIDHEFIDECIVGNKKNEFLKFLGVSLDSEYIFADGRLYDKLKNGLSFIPLLLDRKVNKEEISAELIKNTFVISTKGEKKHPSTINNNDYKFLDKISKPSLKVELDNLLVRKYDSFPKEYRDILQDRIENSLSSKLDIIRLYQSIFNVYQKGNAYLVIENGKLRWSNTLDFSIVSSKVDFDLCTQIPNKKVLCYYSNQNLPNILEYLIVKPQKGEISVEAQVENTNRKRELVEKIVYILLSISLSKNSEINYLDDDRDLQEIQKKIESLKIIEGNNLEQKIYFDADIVSSDKMYAFDDKKSGELYFNQNSNKKQIAAGISDFIFNNTSIAESVELILFHKNIEDLRLEFDKNEIAIIQKKWKTDYNMKFILFQKAILQFFNIADIVDEKWYIYNSAHKSNFLVQVDKNNQLEQLKEVVLEQKSLKQFESYFDDFELNIDFNNIIDRISIIKLRLDSIENVSKQELINRINTLKIKLGCEFEIDEIENEINSLYPKQDSILDKNLLEAKKREVFLETRIENIFNSLATEPSKMTEQTEFTGTTISQPLIAKIKKTIFQNNESSTQNGQDLEIMGANGEERVLYYFIMAFLKLDIKNRIKGINEVYDLLIQKLKNYPMLKYKLKCIEVVENDEELKKALIPLFYVAMHHKYSYFDLIVFKDNCPTLIEVKTTFSDNNNRFFLSIAEVDAARGNDKYEIVRDSPSSINFLGNPIKLLENSLASVSGENFILTPRNYEFKFKN